MLSRKQKHKDHRELKNPNGKRRSRKPGTGSKQSRGARYRESTDGYTPLSKDVFVATSIYILRIRIFKLCGQYNNMLLLYLIIQKGYDSDASMVFCPPK